jgi:hypothetical protein
MAYLLMSVKLITAVYGPVSPAAAGRKPKSHMSRQVLKTMNMYRRMIALGLTIVVSCLFVGCATLLAPKTHPLSLASEPQGAQVYVNGVNMGMTPVKLELKADQNYTIEFRKEGYETQSHIVNSQVGAGWVIVDVLFGLVPVIVDAATGAWNKLDQESVEAVLYKQNL